MSENEEMSKGMSNHAETSDRNRRDCTFDLKDAIYAHSGEKNEVKASQRSKLGEETTVMFERCPRWECVREKDRICDYDKA